MPKISVIVPVYNTEQYLPRCIDSILAQTFTDFELLLIDDGSTDSSGEICDEYAHKDSRVRVFHKENGGVCSARNVGLDYAKGIWVTFADSDDYVTPMWLELFIKGNKFDIVVCGIEFDRKFNDSFPYSKIGLTYNGNACNGLLKLYSFPMIGSLCNKCFKRTIIEKNSLRLSEDFDVQEDEEFFMRYMSFCSLMCSVEDCGYFYFLPEWEIKHPIIRNPYRLYQSLYKSANLIFRGKMNDITLKYLHCFSETLYDGFKNKEIEAKVKLMQYRKTVGGNVRYSKFNFFARWMIYLDNTGCFSSGVLNLQIWLNKFKKKTNI